HLVCGKTKFGISLDKNLMGIGSKLMVSVKKMLPADNIFVSNAKRFEYDDLEEAKDKSRVVEYGKGTQ
ncbi:MAG: hypothetical protein J6T68_03515, partial [Candidatus Methanomethylophilaceae archaeon]|nr:hypothetical protein [Candidatus Methanomethylophilaceae archaeon]